MHISFDIENRNHNSLKPYYECENLVYKYIKIT